MNVLIKEHYNVIPAIITCLAMATNESTHCHRALDWDAVQFLLEHEKIDLIIIGTDEVNQSQKSLIEHLIELALYHDGAPVIVMSHSLEDNTVTSFDDKVFYVNKRGWIAQGVQEVLECFRKAIQQVHGKGQHTSELSFSE